MNVSVIKSKTFFEKLTQLMGDCYKGIDPEDIKNFTDYAVTFVIPKKCNPLGASILVVDNVHGVYGFRLYIRDENLNDYVMVYEKMGVSIEECAEFTKKSFGFFE